jgi:hypothetical protein
MIALPSAEDAETSTHQDDDEHEGQVLGDRPQFVKAAWPDGVNWRQPFFLHFSGTGPRSLD